MLKMLKENKQTNKKKSHMQIKFNAKTKIKEH